MGAVVIRHGTPFHRHHFGPIEGPQGLLFQLELPRLSASHVFLLVMAASRRHRDAGPTARIGRSNLRLLIRRRTIVTNDQGSKQYQQSQGQSENFAIGLSPLFPWAPPATFINSVLSRALKVSLFSVSFLAFFFFMVLSPFDKSGVMQEPSDPSGSGPSTRSVCFREVVHRRRETRTRTGRVLLEKFLERGLA